jgi:hypothetical protein
VKILPREKRVEKHQQTETDEQRKGRAVFEAFEITSL